MNAIQQFFELVARRFYEIEAAKRFARQIERAEILVNLQAALRTGEITQAQYDELYTFYTGKVSHDQP